MPRDVLINFGIGEIRIALLADGRLEEFSLERGFGGGASLVGDIIYGRVQRVMPGMQAAFVDIGQARAGFLALREALPLAGEAADISSCVQEGQALLLQVIKDPVGEKGARLSAAITLAGHLLVMTPGQPGLSLSRRIEDEAVRQRLLALGRDLQTAMPQAGFVLRTAAADAPPADVTAEADALMQVWHGIAQRRQAARPPATLYREPGPLERTLRDMAGADVARVRIDDAGAVEAARAYCRRAMPDAQGRIELARAPIFDDALEEDIARLSRPRVDLPSGGWITIQATEALTAIDVNSGTFHQSSGREETGLTTDLEAAREIGRQLRLRGIGGLIVIDFLHLSRADHAARVLDALADSLAGDRAPVRISPMSQFGIVAVTRKRTRQSLARQVSQSCACCGGSGRQAGAQSLALEILRRVEGEARANPGREILVRAAPAIIQWLTTHDDDVRAGLARRGAGRVRFEISAGEESDVVCC